MSGLSTLDFPKFTKHYILAGTTPATSTNYGVFFVADRPCVIEGFNMRFESAGSATVQLRKIPSGTTISGAGTAKDILASALTFATASTIISGTIQQNAELAVGDALAMVPSATPTNLTNLCATVKLKYIRPA